MRQLEIRYHQITTAAPSPGKTGGKELNTEQKHKGKLQRNSREEREEEERRVKEEEVERVERGDARGGWAAPEVRCRGESRVPGQWARAGGRLGYWVLCTRSTKSCNFEFDFHFDSNTSNTWSILFYSSTKNTLHMVVFVYSSLCWTLRGAARVDVGDGGGDTNCTVDRGLG